LENIEYMPKFVELMTTENVIEIRIVSMHIMKWFEFFKKKYFHWTCPSRFLISSWCVDL